MEIVDVPAFSVKLVPDNVHAPAGGPGIVQVLELRLRVLTLVPVEEKVRGVTLYVFALNVPYRRLNGFDDENALPRFTVAPIEEIVSGCVQVTPAEVIVAVPDLCANVMVPVPDKVMEEESVIEPYA